MNAKITVRHQTETTSTVQGLYLGQLGRHEAVLFQAQLR